MLRWNRFREAYRDGLRNRIRMTPFVPAPCDEGVIRSSPPIGRPTPSAKWILTATILGSGIAFIDGTVVNVALPALQENLNATVVGVQWVVESYSLLLAALLLVGGAMGDRYGRRRIFILGTGLFAVASMWCGLAASIGQLIAARAVQGVGAAFLVPGSLAIISNSFPDEERGRAIGTWSAFTAITAAIGPVLGGWLIETLSWRAVFFLNLPLAALVIVISIRYVPENANQAKGKLDWPGAILATLGLGTLVYGLIESSARSFTNALVLASLTSAAGFLSFFLVLERRRQNPMLPLELFRSRTFTAANLLTFLLYAALGGMFFFLPMNLILVQRYSASAAGAALLPFILLMFLLSRWSGGLVQRWGARIPLVIGPLIAAVAFLLLARPGAGGPYWTTFFPGLAVLGIGMAVSVAPLTTTVMNSVSPERAGVASGINNAVSRAAGLLAIAVFGIFMLRAFSDSLDQRIAQIEMPLSMRQSITTEHNRLGSIQPPTSLALANQVAAREAIAASFVDGFRRLMITAGALAFAGAAVSVLLIPRRR
jgi:EmrB/QacA subfamily drug resistance transporter